MIEVGEEEGAKAQWMTYHVPQGSAMEVLREAIPNGVSYQWAWRGKALDLLYQDESIFKTYDGARKR